MRIFFCKCIKVIEVKFKFGKFEYFYVLFKFDIVENFLLNLSFGFDCMLLVKCFLIFFFV